MSLVRFLEEDGSAIYINPEKVIFVNDCAAVHDVGDPPITRVSCDNDREIYVIGSLDKVAERLAGTAYLKTNLTEA